MLLLDGILIQSLENYFYRMEFQSNHSKNTFTGLDLNPITRKTLLQDWISIQSLEKHFCRMESQSNYSRNTFAGWNLNHVKRNYILMDCGDEQANAYTASLRGICASFFFLLCRQHSPANGWLFLPPGLKFRPARAFSAPRGEISIL